MFFFFKQKTAYEMRISDWSSDVCSSDLPDVALDRANGEADGDGDRPESDGGAHQARAFGPGVQDVAGEDREHRGRPGEQHGEQVEGDRAEQETLDPHELQPVDHLAQRVAADFRSEERRVGKKCDSTYRSRWSPEY